MTYKGGCYCGALRYECNLAPVECGYCHCRICQRTSGAPVLAFASFPVEGFQYVNGEPTIYPSSERGHRELCAKCGTQIMYRTSDGATTADVNVATLDDPTQVTPDHHIWCESQVAWFDTGDSLPRFPQNKPEDEVA